MENIILRLEEELKMVNDAIKTYEEKEYDIFSHTTMANDRLEYTKLLGQSRALELSINIVRAELKDHEIACLKAKIEGHINK